MHKSWDQSVKASQPSGVSCHISVPFYHWPITKNRPCIKNECYRRLYNNASHTRQYLVEVSELSWCLQRKFEMVDISIQELTSMAGAFFMFVLGCVIFVWSVINWESRDTTRAKKAGRFRKRERRRRNPRRLNTVRHRRAPEENDDDETYNLCWLHHWPGGIF